MIIIFPVKLDRQNQMSNICLQINGRSDYRYVVRARFLAMSGPSYFSPTYFFLLHYPRHCCTWLHKSHHCFTLPLKTKQALTIF